MGQTWALKKIKDEELKNPKIFAPTSLMMQDMQLERDDKNIQVKAVAIFLVILGGYRIILFIYQ